MANFQETVSTPRSSGSPQVTSVSARARLGEAPYWFPSLNSLLYVDVLGFEVRRLRYTAKNGETIAKLGYQGLSAAAHLFRNVRDDAVSFIIPVKGSEDQFIVGHGQNIELLTWDGVGHKPAREVLVKVDKGHKHITHGKVDPHGRLWTGTSDNLDPDKMTDSSAGALFSLGPGRDLQKHLGHVSGCSGLQWSPDGKTLFFVESKTSTVDAFDFDPANGTISNRRVVFDFKGKLKGEPRGMTIDEEGKLWVAAFGGSQVVRVDPETGRVMKLLPIPCRDVTNVAFGGDSLADLYVTTCASRLEASNLVAYPGSGTTFRVTGLDIKGLPQREFEL